MVEESNSESSQNSGYVLEIIVGIVGALLVLSIVIIVAIYIIRKTKIFPFKRVKRNMRDGIGKL